MKNLAVAVSAVVLSISFSAFAQQDSMCGYKRPAKACEKLLLDAGVARVFHPGTSLEDIAAEIRTLSTRARAMREKEMP